MTQVILGSNGSGKSTILKLISRLYDPTEGTILINGHDIKTLRMEDIRRAMAMLFQDYTLFPLSVRLYVQRVPLGLRRPRSFSQIKDNIALGDPARAQDDAAIEEAMRLGGASEFIARLPNGLDTYLERPVRDCYAGLPDGASVFGGKVDNGVLQGIMGTPADNALSGGEMQRIAVARTFMRSASEEHKVGLLLFDEPSASLDPAAEQGLTFPAVMSVCGFLEC
jgi:ABC-type multidrug transport system fused ATPase/permease subunit